MLKEWQDCRDPMTSFVLSSDMAAEGSEDLSGNGEMDNQEGRALPLFQRAWKVVIFYHTPLERER